MKYEVLKKSYLKRNIIIGMVVVLILTAVVLTFTRAKYRVTQSVPLVSGTINFSPYDFNVVAMYLNQDGAMPSGQTKEVPKFGYTLNEEQSTCIINDTEDERITMNYVTQTADEKAYVTFDKMSQSGTKCTLYFDLIPDDQAPTVSMSTSSDDTSITVTVNASDNIGVYYYYYKLDDGEEIRSEDPIYKFEGLTKDQTYIVSVRVEDVAGNEASANEEVIVGLKGGDIILASDNAPTNSTTDWINNGTAITYYYTGNPNNWISFAGFYWRIIRINGDGSIRIIYQGTSANATGEGTQIGESYFNYPSENKTYVGLVYDGTNQHGFGTNSTIMTSLNNWYNDNIENDSKNLHYEQYIDIGAGFCSDRNTASGDNYTDGSFYYAPCDRRNGPASLQCHDDDILSQDNGKLPNPIGLVTSDEVVLTGIIWNTPNTESYLRTGQNYWTMSPYRFFYGSAEVVTVSKNGGLSNCINVADVYGVRPVINLRADVQLTGSGTTTDPFVVVTS